MTIQEAKKDLAHRLDWHLVPYKKITGKTVSFEDLGRGSRIFLTVHGVEWPYYTIAETGVCVYADADVIDAGRPNPRPYSIQYRR